MTKKIVNNLPVVLQTTAIRNFFESTVEQLYSTANTTPLKGFIGKRTGDDVGLSGAFIKEDTADRREYNLTPAVNTVNSVTGNSENLVFYDEFIDTLEIYGVDTTNHNTIFGSRYNVFMPPIDIDKFVNFQEYYWVPAGPTAITISATLADPINIELDVIGQATFSHSGTTLRDGMVVIFDDNGYSIPANATSKEYKAGKEYIVYGVGTSIQLIDKAASTNITRYGGSTADDKDYIVMERGAPNQNAWSRTNHWYHRNNFADAGDSLPAREYRAKRPIIEFDRLLEMYDHGTGAYGIATVAGPDHTVADIEGNATFIVDGYTLEDGDTILFPNESLANKVYLYTVSGVGASIVLTPSSTAIQAQETVVITDGINFIGREYIFNGSVYSYAQEKLSINQEPTFVLYDDAKNRLDNSGLYPNSTFVGSKIFNYQRGEGTSDTELGFPLVYTPFKSVSEITFENFIESERVSYTAFGSTASKEILGSYYYKRLETVEEYFSYWKPSGERNEQKIITTYEIDQLFVDQQTIVYDIGATPIVNPARPSGYDIIVKVNGDIRSDYIYRSPNKIQFNEFNVSAGDVIDIEVVSQEGITLENNSRYGLPISWRANPTNEEIEFVAEPEYISHFKRYIESQDGFQGDPLGSSNFTSTAKDVVFAKDIVQTDEDLILAAFLLDDQPHNIVDSIRFTAREYEKYKARLDKEITNYYNTFDTSSLTNEYILERVLRNLISFSIGKDVFNSTYILPFGDNYIQEDFDVADVAVVDYTLANYLDLGKIENGLLVYQVSAVTGSSTLLQVDNEYTITSTNPISIELNVSLGLGDTIVTKLYNENRDSAECPPTPSAMGIYPLFVPAIITDNSFETPIEVLRGHDGSRTPIKGDVRDDILLEYENRIYNTAKSEFRDISARPILNELRIRPGAFREETLGIRQFTDLLRNSYTNWVNANKVDPIVNEFYDATDEWTWNYRGTTDIPGYWKGFYEYYYDTVRPHTAPWEMLGFFEQPTWWEDEYGTDYSSTNTALWSDLEEGIIRQGIRENISDNFYLTNNPYKRTGLSEIIPVDAVGALKTPKELATTGATTQTLTWTNSQLVSNDVVDTLKDYTDNGTNNRPNGITATVDSANVYITNSNTDKTYKISNYGFANLTLGNIVSNISSLSSTTIGVTVTGTPILNPASGTWNDEGNWSYNAVFRNETNTDGVYTIAPENAGLTEWDEANHSPIVGWAFDGIPIYGPYGYTEYAANGSIIDANVTSIQSAFEVRSGTRSTAPFGSFTGEFTQDYTANASVYGTPGFTGSPGQPLLAEFNMRYGVTPESPSTPIYFYVATDDFPFIIGGTESLSNTYEGQFWAETLDIENNNLGTATDDGTTSALTSTSAYTYEVDDTAIDNAWRFGDGAPVENVWKYSVGYPFAVAESLLLAKPGKFATLFADPTNVEVPLTERFKTISKVTRKPFNFTDSEDFRIHGSVDTATNDIVYNAGYTQFIHSWLTYQKYNTTTDFADKVRTVNIKLAHRVAGFTDKDTLTIRTDQVSATSLSSSLIIPDENIDVVVHSSPYKNRNFYTGVMVQKVEDGYKVRGYDKNFGYFNVLRRNFGGKTTAIEVGGQPVSYTNWTVGTSYKQNTIVFYNNAFYKAPTTVPKSDTFIASLWTRLASLPQQGAVKATLYLDSLPQVDRVEYETVFETYQDVVNFLISLGDYQEALGYDFGEVDNDINDVRNWVYTTKQFLFWIAGGWENNNTIELSPLANKVKFVSTTGMISKINRVDKNQFTLIDQNSTAIQPTSCEIIRDGTTIEIVPPEGTQIYGTMLFTKEIEHALIFDNVTNFNDTLFNPLYNQLQKRLRIKGKKTANWSGLLSSEGFIIQDDELRPNLDNMAQSLGRYHELGFIPVEKQIYQTARGLFGYKERAYLNDLEIEDDDQFEFYKGMLQNKGTVPSLRKIAKSNKIVQGTMDVFDEWAFRVGDFGDLENDQSIELKLEKSDVTQDPQMITLAFPEDTTGVVSEVRVIEAKHTYYEAPVLEIAAPTNTPAVQATATTSIDGSGLLSTITVTNEGSGYAEPVRIEIIAGELVVANVNTTFNQAVAQSSGFILESDIASLGLANLIITNNKIGGNVTASLDVSGITSFANIVTLVNEEGTINANITASFVEAQRIVGGNVVNQYTLRLIGDDFTLTEDGSTLANLNITAGRYQPRQRYSIFAVGDHPVTGTGATEESNISVTVDGTEVLSDSGNNWIYDEGSRQSIPFVISGSGAVDVDGDIVVSGDVNVPLDTTLDANNIINYEATFTYPHVDLYINGTQIENSGYEQKYSLTTGQLTIYDVETLPEGHLQQGANIYVVENPTVDFENAYFGDLPGATLRIKTTTNDRIAIITGSKRIYEITEDIKGDETILIDIDDTERFLKRPINVKEYSLWPTMTVNYNGVVEDRYYDIPNAGYVSSSTVDFRSFDIFSMKDMFGDDILTSPSEDNLVHIAVSENRDWNVYKLRDANMSVSFIEQESNDETTYLYTDKSLFDYTDSNQIGNVDLGRFLDYHIVLKNGVVNEEFVVWVNEQVVDSKQLRLSNISGVVMTESTITSIGPEANSILAISNITPGVSGFSTAEAEANIDGVGTALITSDTFQLLDGDIVMFTSAEGNTNPLHANTYAVSNVTTDTFTINDPALTSNVDLGNLIVAYYGKTTIESVGHELGTGELVKIVAGPYSGNYLVESASANTFVIDAVYQSSATTTGNILLDSITITTGSAHGIDTNYAGKKIAVHNAEPRYYNQVYTVASTTSNTITVSGTFAYADEANVMANAVVTTLDHDMFYLNNSAIKLDNINSVDGIIDSFNRGMELRRGWVTGSGSFTMSIPMNKRTISSQGVSGSQVAGSMPYQTALPQSSLKNVNITGSLKVDPAIVSKVGFGNNVQSASSTLNASPFNPTMATGNNPGNFDPSQYTATDVTGRSLFNYGMMAGFNPGNSNGQYLNFLPAIGTSNQSYLSWINIPKITPTNRSTNSTPNNTGAVVINPTAVVSAPRPKVCGDPVGTPTITGGGANNGIYEKCEFVQQANTSVGVIDTWYYKIVVPGTVKIIFDMGPESSEIQVYQGSTRGSSTYTLARTTGGIRRATSDEKLLLNKGKSGTYSSTSTSLPVDWSVDNAGYVFNCGVLEFKYNPAKGEWLYIHVDKGPSSVSYRYAVCYPSPTDTVNPKLNINAGQPASIPPYTGQGTPDMSGIAQTPIIQPSVMPTTKRKKTGNGSYTYYNTNEQWKYAPGGESGYYHNFGGFSLAPMAGYSFIPSTFRRTVKSTTPENTGRYQDLSSGRYVNTSVQRVSGGAVVPLAAKVRAPISIDPKPLRGLDLSNDPLYKTLGDVAGGKDIYLKYQPKKIGSNLYSTDLQSISSGQTTGNTGPDSVITFNVLPGALPSTVPGSPLASTGEYAEDLIPAYTLDAADSPVNIDDFDYNRTPVMTILPKRLDENGDLVAAGPVAYAPISRPTPSVTIGLNDLVGARPGDEIFINGQSITIEASPEGTLKNLECSVGSGYTAIKTSKKGDPALKLTSCTNAPINFKNGCRGGVYKEVLDYHIVKSFSMSTSETSNTAVMPSVSGWYNGTTGDVERTATYTLYDAEGVSTGTAPQTSTTTTGSILSSVNETTHTGGSGYSVGDRLRVVGGTPVASPFGEVKNICIGNTGANYTSAANVKVFIGDGSTPGTGATVSSVTLDENGGIDSIVMGSVGAGYDPSRPPTVRIIDVGEASSSDTIVPAKLQAEIRRRTDSGRIGYGLPERPAKFIVSGVSATGAITGLTAIDRGIYKDFPSDLTTGIPLEYDIVNLGDEYDGSIPPTDSTGLGTYDPITYEKLGTPGGYDPIRGKYEGGTGARVFLTARELPDCSEKSDALSKLQIPITLPDISVPSHLADLLNASLIGAGYDPNDINFSIDPINDDLDSLVLNAPGFDGIEVGEMTPGFLDKLGLPPGDYNASLTEYAAVGTGDGMSIYGTCGFANDVSSILGTATTECISDLYQYELRALSGNNVTSTKDSKNVQVLYMESQRYSTEADIATANASYTEIPATIAEFDNIWIDDYNNTGWAYLENGVVKRQQEALVDPKFIKNTIIYDSTTGRKDYDYDIWDPFKGVLPAIIDAEIKYVSKRDPVVYNASRAMFGKKNVGQVWWDTSTVRYNWYEQGTNRERWLNWGSSFPGSIITIFEWAESVNPPLEYVGTGTPKNGSEYIIERRKDPVSNEYRNYYYFWVQNVEEISSTAATAQNRKFNGLQIARYLADPNGQGLNTIGFISAGQESTTNAASFVMSNLTKTLREDEQNIQINLSRNLNPIGLKHSSWKLIREGNNALPEDLILKLIDSLTEVDSAGNVVPADNLSNVERYGVKFRPRQTMFKNAKEARRVLHYVVNEIFADTKLETLSPGWNDNLTSTEYIKTINWYAVDRIDSATNEKIRFDNSYKASFTVSSVKELNTLTGGNLPDGSVIMVRALTTDRYQLWRYTSNDGFTLIAIENETIRLADTVYTDDSNSTMQEELRALLVSIRDTIFNGTEILNEIFFALVKYAVGEQQQLDWVFKTSYVYIQKEEEDLVQRIGYKPDNFDSVVEYLNEVKPYTAKVREYKDGKRAPLEEITDQMISDYDFPAYADSTIAANRILDFDNVIDQEILASDPDYNKINSVFVPGQTEWDANAPVRVGTINLTFDRIDWRLVENDFDANASSYSQSIAVNIANLNAATTEEVSNTLSNAYSMSSRIFKFDPDVQLVFNAEIDAYFGAGSSSNTSITQNSSLLEPAIDAGALNNTLYLVKEKVGGTWQGEELDGDLFNRVVPGSNGLIVREWYAWDTGEWDSTIGFGAEWDSAISVENFEGLFDGNSTYREGGITYDGFDGFSFKHMLYGEERPEELVYLSPLENFVMHVRTDTFAYSYDGNGNITGIQDALSVGPYEANISTSDGNATVTVTSVLAVPFLDDGDNVTLAGTANTIVDGSYIISNINVSANTFTIGLANVDANVVTTAGTITLTSGITAVPVEYLIHLDLFGGTEYLRVLGDGSTSTTTTAKVEYWDEIIEVLDASVLPVPNGFIPGVIWLDHSERIEYRRIDGNTIRDITRGTRGTTIPNSVVHEYDPVTGEMINTTVWNAHPPGVSVIAGSGDNAINFDNAGGDPEDAIWIRSDALSLTDTNTNNAPIAGFIQGGLSLSVGWDSKGWDTDLFDS